MLIVVWQIFGCFTSSVEQLFKVICCDARGTLQFGKEEKIASQNFELG
jgi:hypothetical protein